METPASLGNLIASSATPVLVDFFAEWCGPCKLLAPTVSALARSHKGRLLVVQVDVDKKPSLATAHDVAGVPTLVLFWKGRELGRLSGAHPRERIEAELRKAWPLDAAPLRSHP